MRIKRIYIKDFGIYRDEKIEEINSDIVVIGGYNRAGKTSFMQLFRHLGYGFSTGNKYLPKANIEYEVNYDIENEMGEIFNVSINGNGSPKVKGLNTKKEATIEELFGNVDYFTYKQLFTISLDELQNTSLEDSKEISNMQSILLGAGFKEIIHIPKLIKELQNEAKTIGASKGSANTGQFKIHNKDIKKGIELREKAKSQVQLYQEKSIELKNIELDIEKTKGDINASKEEVTLLGLIKNNFHNYTKLNELKIRLDIENKDLIIDENITISKEKALSLKEEYEEILNKYKEKYKRFIQAIGNITLESSVIGDTASANAGIKDKLLSHKENLLSYNQGISGIKEKINNYKELKNKCARDRVDALKEMLNINESWKDDFNRVISLKTDIIEENKLNSLTREEISLSNKKAQALTELKNLQLNIGVLEKTFGGKPVVNVEKMLARYFYIALCLIVIGIALFFKNSILGVTIAISGSVLGGAYGLAKYSSSNNKSDQGSMTQLNNLKAQEKQKREELDNINTEADLIKRNIEEYKSLLGIKEEVSGEMLKEYFRKIKELKNRIINLKRDIDRANKEAVEIEERIAPMVELLKKFKEIISSNTIYNEDYIIQNSSIIFEAIIKLAQYTSIAEQLQLVGEEKNSLEEKIMKYIGGKEEKEDIVLALEAYIEKCKNYEDIRELKREVEILEKTLENATTLMNSKVTVKELEEEFHRFISIEQVEEELASSKNDLKAIEERLQELIKNRENVKYQLENLYSTESIEEAQEKIDEGRKAILPLAKRYATLRAAEFMLEKVRNNFVEKTQDFLLRNASELFSEMTGGEYESILPMEDFMKLDFKTLLKDGTMKENSGVLSRATKEQLFLSVRLSRISEINPPLPIILDDSFVNFDEIHTKEVLSILCRLSKRNQIFITTCHPKLVEYFGEISHKIKYLRLENGKFHSISREKLIDYLSVK